MTRIRYSVFGKLTLQLEDLMETSTNMKIDFIKKLVLEGKFSMIINFIEKLDLEGELRVNQKLWSQWRVRKRLTYIP